MSTSPQRPLTPLEIRRNYFGLHSSPRDHVEESPTLKTSLPRNATLTPSAKFVAQEARRRLGQQSTRSSDEEQLLRLVEVVESEEGEELSDKERTAVLASLSASLQDYDILAPLIQNPAINDIIVRAYNDISVQANRSNVQTDIRFPDHESYLSFVENLLKRVGKACTLAQPVVDVSLDPNVRACVTHESFSPPGSGPMLTLRIARHHNISLEGLIQHELAPRVVLDYLAALVRDARATLLIAGEVGTGKTTLVKALAMQIPDNEAILVVEDTHELVLQRRFVRTLLTREANSEGNGRISPATAIRTGMRMAMNRVILGEMRDGEAAETFIDVCSSGHSGFSTIHSRSARDALARLELFLGRVQAGVTTDTIRRQIANALSVIVYLDVDRYQEKRRITEVVEVSSSSDGMIQLSPMFRLQPGPTPRWTREAGVSRYDDILRRQNLVLPAYGANLEFGPTPQPTGPR